MHDIHCILNIYIYMVYHCVYVVLDNILVYNTIILDMLSIIGNIWPTSRYKDEDQDEPFQDIQGHIPALSSK